MKVTDILYPQLIKVNLTASSKEEAFSELAGLMAAHGFLYDKEEYLEKVFHRESLGSTGVGMSVAIPHGKSKAVKEACVAFGRSENGIDFQDFDDPARFIFLIAVPESADNRHLEILAKLSRMLIHPEVREELGEATSKEDVLQTLSRHD